MISEFRGQYRWLSNFYPVQITWRGFTFASVEHAYQASKCADPEDLDKFLDITAGEAKSLGRRIKLRIDWEDENVKLPLMERLLRIKFARGTGLADNLIATGDQELVEGNHWRDRFWGGSVHWEQERII